MRISYSWDRKDLPKILKQLTVIAALCALTITMRLNRVAASTPSQSVPVQSLQAAGPDPRTIHLAAFLNKLHCPVSSLSEDFIHAADDNGLDWRLLPSIAVIESGGGKAYRNNNIFGWDSGAVEFPTVRSGINEVAFKLGKSRLYRDKSVIAKLHLYNPDETYATSVLAVMRRISPIENLVPSARLVRHQDQFVYETD